MKQREKQLKTEKREKRLGKMKIKRETERMVEKKKKMVEAEQVEEGGDVGRGDKQEWEEQMGRGQVGMGGAGGDRQEQEGYKQH